MLRAEVSERLVRKKQVYSQPFYDPSKQLSVPVLGLKVVIVNQLLSFREKVGVGGQMSPVHPLATKL